MRKDRSKLIIRICLVLIIFSFVTFYGTSAFFADSEELSTGINITTGTLDIQLKDSFRNTIGDQSYILNLDPTTKSQMIGNLTISDIGSLSSNLSTKIIVGGPIDVAKLFQLFLVDATGKEIPLSETYKLLSNVQNTGATFGVKILFSGALPVNYGELAIKVVFRATQPNDDFSNPKMFTDIQEIRVDMPRKFQIAFDNGIPIEGAVIVKHSEDVYINLLPKGLNIKDVLITFRDNKFFTAIYDPAIQRITIRVNGNNNSDVIKIKVTLTSGEIYYIERDIQSANTP